MRGSGQRLPITLRFTRVLGTFSHTTCFPFSCALWACFSDRSVSGERSKPIGAPMPHAALCVVQLTLCASVLSRRYVSMPHAAVSFRPHHRFAVPLPRSRRGGLVTRRFLAESRNISFPRRCGGSGERSEPIGAPIPHAALWVVQQDADFFGAVAYGAFQCRTRLFPFAPTTASRSPSPARAGEAFRLRYAGFSARCAGRGLLHSTVAA